MDEELQTIVAVMPGEEPGEKWGGEGDGEEGWKRGGTRGIEREERGKRWEGRVAYP